MAPINGTNGNDTLVGTLFDDVINGFAGADTMKGRAGNDTYYVDNWGDKVVEKEGEGIDTIISSIDRVLDANVENLTLAAGAGNIKGWGNALDNVLIGNEASNMLYGDLGADTMVGGKGDDIYFVDNAGDKIVEKAGEGGDMVISSVSFSLAAFANVETLALDGSAIKATGNTLNNFLYGNDSNNILDGGAGADEMSGAKGNDTYYVDNKLDKVQEDFGEGTDTIISTVALTSAVAEVENYDFSKLAGGVTFTGNALNNVIKGGAGIDKLTGGLGSDTYYVNSTQDVIVELAGQGKDTIATGSFSVDLSDYANVESVLLLGGSALNAIGTSAANALTGNAGANFLDGQGGSDILDGKGGADIMQGGWGNDTYYVDNAGDQVKEKLFEGTDTVISSITRTLEANVENLTLAAGAGSINGTGNALNNTLIGNTSSNILDGKGGADTMKGGTGYDKYYVDNLSDLIIEDFNGGEVDTVYSTVALTKAIANVENYDFSKATSAVNFTGSDANNQIWSSQYADTLAGGKGLDVYRINNVTDKVVELAGEGDDSVYATVNVTKLWDNVERVYYDGTSPVANWTAAWNATGNDLDNIIGGNGGANVLNGGKGDDYLEGGLGNDVLIGGEGADTFRFSGAGFVGTSTETDVIKDFDLLHDILDFSMAGPGVDGDDTWGELEDIVAGIFDHGAGKDVVVDLVSGGSIIFTGIGTGQIDSITDLVADATTQIIHS